MAGKRRAAVPLLLLGLVGCHQGEPEAVVQAKQEHFHAKQTLTDRASLIYAQQEIGLAETKAVMARSAGSPVDEESEQAANRHLQQAELQLKIDQDNLQLDEDQEKWQSFARVLTATQPHENRH